MKWLATLVWYVTAGHEQDGAVEVYAQDGWNTSPIHDH